MIRQEIVGPSFADVHRSYLDGTSRSLTLARFADRGSVLSASSRLWRSLVVFTLRNGARPPNFGIEGAIPERRRLPDWMNTPPGPLPTPPTPWPRPPSPPGPAPWPEPSRPQSFETRDAERVDALNWLLATIGASRRQDAMLRRPAVDNLAPADELVRPAPWSGIEPTPDLIQHLPFRTRPDSALERARPEDLLQPLVNKRPNGLRTVQPPIFFPFD